MSIELKELLPTGTQLEDLPEEHQKNILALLPKLQAFREKCGLPMVCTSGYRTLAHHLEIYKQKNELLQKQGLAPLHIPMGSHHLDGHAVDFSDKDRKLAEFVDNNQEWCKSMGFHFEAKNATEKPQPWLHIQDVSPKSGALWFEP